MSLRYASRQPLTMALHSMLSTRTILVDLDNCLVKTKATNAIPFRIAKFAVDRLGFDAFTAAAQCKRMYEKYGTNLEAFWAEGYDVDPFEYHAAVHGFTPYHTIEKKTELRTILDAIPVEKFIFTNADVTHAEKMLDATGLRGCFEGIIGFETLQSEYNGPLTACKPKKEAMRLAMKFARARPETTVFFDDAPRNVRMGMEYGVRSVQVGMRDAHGFERIARIEQLGSVVTGFS